jgi:hypothetical protein
VRLSPHANFGENMQHSSAACEAPCRIDSRLAMSNFALNFSNVCVWFESWRTAKLSED